MLNQVFTDAQTGKAKENTSFCIMALIGFQNWPYFFTWQVRGCLFLICKKNKIEKKDFQPTYNDCLFG